MKNITASTIKGLEKAVNEFIHTNSAYRPEHLTLTLEEKPVKKTKQKQEEPEPDQEAKVKKTYSCLLAIVDDTRQKTCTFFHGSLAELANSPLAEIPGRSITHQKIISQANGEVLAFTVQ